MERFLFDVSTLLAFLDPLHIHHHAAHRWYKRKQPIALLICSYVENGVMRIASQPRYPNPLGTASTIRELLAKFIELKKVERCSQDPSLLDARILKKPALLTPSSIADLYLLAVAVENSAKLDTYDQRIQPSAIHGMEKQPSKSSPFHNHSLPRNMSSTTPVTCPTCFESFEIPIPPETEMPTEYDYDCEVCCRPMLILLNSPDDIFAQGLGD